MEIFAKSEVVEMCMMLILFVQVDVKALLSGEPISTISTVRLLSSTQYNHNRQE